jgi:hypothetical protein
MAVVTRTGNAEMRAFLLSVGVGPETIERALEVRSLPPDEQYEDGRGKHMRNKARTSGPAE